MARLIPAMLLAVVQAAGYGLDCSFPIHSFNRTLNDDCGDLGSRQNFYEEYMDGCRGYYSADDCDFEEDIRLAMNIRQPQSMVNFTSGGFRKIKAPLALQKLLSEFWETNKRNTVDEEWTTGNIYTNHWAAPTKMLSVEDKEMEGGGEELKAAIWAAAQAGVEEWTQEQMRPSSLYGIRVYQEGAVLNPHVDRLPLVTSCIVNVAQDVDEDWPLEVYDRFGDAVNVTMDPFDMVFYESHSLVHGRPFPLKGRYYANVFIHFEVLGSIHDDADELQNDDFVILPPYIIPDSPEAEHWLKDHPSGWFKGMYEDDFDEFKLLAGNGDIEGLSGFLEAYPRLVHYYDENGWQPIHEAVRWEQTESVLFLIENGADINARTEDGTGASPLNIAKTILGLEHPLYNALERLGAEDLGGDLSYLEDANSEDEDDWGDEEYDEDDNVDDDDWGDEEDDDDVEEATGESMGGSSHDDGENACSDDTAPTCSSHDFGLE